MKSKFDLYQLITSNIDDYAQYGMASVYEVRPKARIQLFGSALTIGRRYACELDQNRNDQAGP